jgi:hypothetical protein
MAPQKKAPAYPKIDIVERRIRSGGSNELPLRAVALKDQPEPMVTRIINTDLPGRYWQTTEDLGWTPVAPEELLGGVSGDLRVVDGRVVAGEHGKEVLVKMPRRLYEAVSRAKADRLERSMQSAAAMRRSMTRNMEADAAQTDRAGAERLERAAERLGGIEIDQLTVSKERVALE